MNFDFSGVDKPDNEKAAYGLRYAEFVVPMVKAMQQQQVIIEEQQKKIDGLEKTVLEQQKNAAVMAQQQKNTATLEQRIERLEALLASQEKAGDGSLETRDNSSLSIYPNPTDGIVTISINNESRQPVRFQLTDVRGEVVLTRTSSDATISMTLDLSGYPAGNYILTATQGNQTMSKVIVFGGK